MQVPTVTLEDLQAFQAEHFPGHPSTLISAAPEPDTEDYGEDDLGYYPDGVKRTLTDEQIEIFRHSEIHALLRARQLQQDDAEYEARRQLPEDAEPPAEVESHKRGSAVDETRNKENVKTKPKAEESSATKMSHRTFERETHDPGLKSLDYGESRTESSAQTKYPESHPPYPRRRIISYED